MDGGGKRKKKKELSPSGGKRQTSSTNQLTANGDKTQTGKHANSPSDLQQPANEAERGKSPTRSRSCRPLNGKRWESSVAARRKVRNYAKENNEREEKKTR